ncbi:MAG TPA: hydantoinase/oxoprolinase family protein [Steroidobacteraceae bacterium]|nr:hydantoinase/oxoprolinase family protein [Steroidobacteraceae bacterium]
MRFAVDTGGTFTDLIVDDDAGTRRMFKAPTTPADPIQGLLDVLGLAAEGFGIPRQELLRRGTHFVHGTTHAINAIITGRTARTAFLTSAGHPDVLVLRQGGRAEAFNFTTPYPEPYIPRALTFEVDGRIRADGSEFVPLDEAHLIATLGELRVQRVEAVAVCLLWSIVNSAHEVRVGELLDQHLSGVPYTLSHRLNPSVREFRRASSTAIDASLKPLMTAYMRTMEERLRAAGFNGRVLVVTSQAGVIDAREAAEAPIKIVNSGPSMAPVAGRYFGALDEDASTIIVADTGGTTYDVSLVRKGVIPVTRDTWIGPQYSGLMVGFPWVDVRSVGAGGGSIASVDAGRLLHVGPQSAGAVPGPVCYGRGGTRVTVSDASLVLGHLDPAFFLGGQMPLDRAAAESAIARQVAEPLGLDVTRAAAAILAVATENMAQAIVDITVNQGIDPRDAVLIGGGGAAGLNSVQIARRLGCRRLVIPVVGAALSAAGALMSDLRADFHQACLVHTGHFDRAAVNAVLRALRQRCEDFAAAADADRGAMSIHFTAEARYASQVWEIEAPVHCDAFESDSDVARLVEDFHGAHADLFTFADRAAAIEIIGWTAHVACRLNETVSMSLTDTDTRRRPATTRRAYFPDGGWVVVPVRGFDVLQTGETVAGPAIIESAFTTVVVDPGATAIKRPSGSLSIEVGT